MRFYRHESPNPARVAKRRGWDLVTSDGKTHKTIPYAYISGMDFGVLLHGRPYGGCAFLYNNILIVLSNQ